MILERISEERRLQKLNEDAVLWRIAQILFGSLYLRTKNCVSFIKNVFEEIFDSRFYKLH